MEWHIYRIKEPYKLIWSKRILYLALVETNLERSAAFFHKLNAELLRIHHSNKLKVNKTKKYK